MSRAAPCGCLFLLFLFFCVAAGSALLRALDWNVMWSSSFATNAGLPFEILPVPFGAVSVNSEYDAAHNGPICGEALPLPAKIVSSSATGTAHAAPNPLFATVLNWNTEPAIARPAWRKPSAAQPTRNEFSIRYFALARRHPPLAA